MTYSSILCLTDSIEGQSQIKIELCQSSGGRSNCLIMHVNKSAKKLLWLAIKLIIQAGIEDKLEQKEDTQKISKS
jgi:hypothetical protein